MSVTNVSYEDLVFDLPPGEFVRNFTETSLFQEIDGPILDLGCATGRHSRYLAKLGATVIGVNNHFDETRAAKELGGGENGNLHYVVGDIRKLMMSQPVGAVLVNEVLDQLDEPERWQVLEAARALTKPGGLHVVSGYLNPSPRAEAFTERRAHRDKYLNSGELGENYQAASWDILSYEEGRSGSVIEHSQLIHVNKVELIARKPV